MRPTDHAASVWADQQRFRSSPAWKLLSAAPWTLAFLRAEFTQARPRIPLEEFHAALDAFLKHLRAEGAGLGEQWGAPQYADAWVRSRFLSRPLVDGRFTYEPTAHTARVLTFLEGFSGAGTHLNSSRLNTLLTSIEALAHETDPDPQARIRQLEAEIADRRARIARLESGGDPDLMPDDGAVAAARSVLDLASHLPADFKRMRNGVREMLHQVRREIMESSMAKGVAVGQVLEGDRQLRGTPEGETFRGFTEFLNDPQRQARFRQAVNEVLERDFVDGLTPQERHTLANLLRELRRQAGEVHSSYGKLSESLHAYVQSDEFRESQLLRKSVRAAELAVSASPALRARTSAAAVRLYSPAFTTVAGLGIFDPAEHVAPPRLADPPALTEADIHRTPSTPQADPAALRDAVARARRHAAGDATLGAAFAALPADQRHLNSLRHLVQTARTTGEPMDPSRYERLPYLQVDGSERAAYLPVITFAKDPA
ncbi:DUF3375 domain-containing protein [Arthrobacter halodurans]|uniref:DUF3375 domain-containing protein n=1 Tax=Arthrobacter halodurans TaxID=516699 RepID=A0ABV4UPV7_9MICC